MTTTLPRWPSPTAAGCWPRGRRATTPTSSSGSTPRARSPSSSASTTTKFHISPSPTTTGTPASPRLLISSGNFMDKKLFVWDTLTGAIVASCALEEPIVCLVWGGMVRDIKWRETQTYRFAACYQSKVLLGELNPKVGSIALYMTINQEKLSISKGLSVSSIACAFRRTKKRTSSLEPLLLIFTSSIIRISAWNR
jgi:hypothetical protein